MTRTITCACGVVIPYRNIPDYYRLTPQHAEIRAKERIGVQPSYIKQFLDRSEALTRQGEVILKLKALVWPGTRHEPIYRWAMQYCRRIGYLEYVCPQCERTVNFQTKKKKRRR